MKKYLLLIGLIFCSGLATAQTFQRTNKGPAFFMPADAMNKPQPRQQRRALPTQPQQVQQQPKQQPKPQATATIQKTQPPATAPKTSATTKTNPPAKAKPTVTAAQPKIKLQPQQTAKQDKPVQIKQKNIGYLAGIKKPKEFQPATPPVLTQEKQPAQPTQPKNIFEQIMADYEHDIKLIGQKQKVRNTRLQKVLSSFQDQDIPF